MGDLLHTWPWWGLGLGVALLAMAGRPRWHDPAWLLKLALPIYMLHQFEEHGVDLLGQHFAFQAEMCRVLGFAEVLHCPADPPFLMAVNVGGVWIAGALAWFFRTRRPLVGASAVALLVVNGLLHAVVGAVTARYNPGLLSALVLFLPYGLWTFLQLHRQGLLRAIQLVPVLLCGVVMHVVLVGSLMAELHGFLSAPVVLVVQVLNGFLPLAFGAVAARGQGRAPDLAPA